VVLHVQHVPDCMLVRRANLLARCCKGVLQLRQQQLQKLLAILQQQQQHSHSSQSNSTSV
jgi:exonuclease VII small subunit